MARAGGPGGGSDPGNQGGGAGGSKGGTGGDGPGSNTPGPRDGNGRGRTDNTGPDGRGDNTPGRPDDSGRGDGYAPGGNSDFGSDTPGHPDNEGRRGNTAPGATGGGRDGRGSNTPGSPASRARDAMARHERNRERSQATEKEGLVDTDLGIGEGYSHPDAIAERARTGMVSPREMDMARGYKSGKDAEMAGQTVGELAGDTLSRGVGLPGVGEIAQSGVKAVAGKTVPTPESEYGASVARKRASNTMAQSAAQVGATMLGGPVAGMAAGAVNTAINDRRTQDINRMSEALGMNQTVPAVAGSGNGTTNGMLTEARNAIQRPPAQANFQWSPVSVGNYQRGLLSLAQNS